MTIIDDALATAKVLDPNAPVVQAVEDAAATVADPSPANIARDIELAMGFIKQLHGLLAGTHPTVLKVVKTIIKEMF